MATITWDGGAGTFNFGDALNWDTNTIPGSGDDAVIQELVGTPTISVAGNRTIRSLFSTELIGMSSGTLTLQANSTFSNGMTLNGGSLNVASGAVLIVGGTSQLTGTAALVGFGEYNNQGEMTFSAADFAFNGTLRNSGMLTHNSGQLILGNTGKWINEATGLYIAGASGGITNSGQGGWIVQNFGIIEHDTGVFNIGYLDNRATVRNNGGALSTWELTNSGNIFVSAGSYNLSVNGGGNNSLSGRIDAAAGATVSFTGSWQLHDGARFSGEGAFDLTGASFSLDGSITLDPETTLSMTSGSQIALYSSGQSEISGGTISVNIGVGTSYGFLAGGGGESRINSNVQWVSGNINVDFGSKLTLAGTTTWGGTGQLVGGGVLRNEGTLTYNPGAARILVSTIENAGTFVHPSSFALVFNAGAQFDNLASGLFDLQSTLANPITAAGTTGTRLINNYGEFRKSSTGASTLPTSITFNNLGGTLNGQQGSLSITGAGSLYAGVNFTGLSGATVSISNISTWSGTVTGSGGVNALITGAQSMTVAPTGLLFNVTTSNLLGLQTSMTGGVITVAAGSHLKVGNASHAISNQIDVYGTVTRIGNTTAFSVQSPGVLNVQQGGVFISNATGNIAPFQGSGVFNIYGTLRKISADNTSFASPNLSVLGGTIDVQAGTMALGGTTGRFENVHFTTVAGTSLTLSGQQVWKGIFSGTGTGTIARSNFGIDPAGVTLDFPNGLNWSGGQMIGGPVTVPTGSTLSVTSTTAKILATHLEIFGTFNTQGAVNFAVNNPGVLHVKPGGTLLVGGILVGLQAGSTAGQIINEGTIRTTSGSASITPPLDSPGVVEVLAGTSLGISQSVAQHPGTTLLGGTWKVAGTLTFPSGGSAVTTIGPGASVTLDGATASFPRMEANQLQSNQGQLTIKGGKSLSTFRQFSNSGTITVEAGSSLSVSVINPSPSSYTQTSGATILVGSSITAQSMTLNGGVLSGSGTITTNLTNSGGVVGPGASPGKITIAGNYTQGAAGTLDIEVGGTNAATPDFDQLVVSGSATLGGTLNVSAIEGFLPSKGETFRFLSAGSRVGDFATTILAPYQGYPLFGTHFGANFYDLNSLNIIVRNSNDTGLFSFRQAIIDANLASDPDVILFNIPGSGPFTLAPTSALPTITHPLTIDGYAELGSSLNTLAIGSNAVLKVELDGSNAGALFVNGLDITAPNTIVKGLTINRFSGNQIQLMGNAATGVIIAGNHLGTNLNGTAALVHPSANTFSAGIGIAGGAHLNWIGTNGDGVNDFGERNVISGNHWAGVHITGNGSDSNVVAGNYIGTNAMGTLAVPNGDLGQYGAGVVILSGAKSNRIGTDGSNDAFNANERNILSGQNNGDGVLIQNVGSDLNSIAGNYIGLNAAGTSAIPNGLNGVGIGGSGLMSGPTLNRIGADDNGLHDDLERNVISGNLSSGLFFEGSNGNFITGNEIGTNAAGNAALGNQQNGIRIVDSANTQIGGNSAIVSNVISGNLFAGIYVSGATSILNQIQGNFIGTDKAGSAAIANLLQGVVIDGASQNLVGGTAQGSGNLISGNGQDGVHVLGVEASNNHVEGNRVGTNGTGTSAIPNGGSGVSIQLGAHDNVVGGIASGAGNLISGNVSNGVKISGVGSESNQIKGNRIGVNLSGLAMLSNGANGVLVESGASSNVIGGTTSADRNLISGNFGAGVALSDVTTSNNSIQGNFIGVDASGASSLANANSGVLVEAAVNNWIGGVAVGSGNVLSGNSVAGIRLSQGARGNQIGLNFIGTDANGNFSVSNPIGVLVDSSANQNLIGTDNAHSNILSGNSIAGIQVTGVGTLLNEIRGNVIGLDRLGDKSIPNGTGILVDGGATGNIIGAGIPSNGNVVSGNSGDGIWITGANTHDLNISFNIIGPNVTGALDRGNGRSGVRVDGGANQVVLVENTIGANRRDGIEVDGPGVSEVTIDANRIGLDLTGSFLIGNDRYGISLGSGALSTTVEDNLISGNSTGIRNDASGTVLNNNLIGTNASGLKSLGNRRGSGLTTDGHIGILSSGANVQIGNIGKGNIVVGHDVGIWIKEASSNGMVVDNRVGTDASTLLSMPNTIGIKMSDGVHDLTLDQNTIANSLTSGLRLLDGTSNSNTFTGNRYSGNLGLAIDGGSSGLTINDGGDSDGLLNFPVLEFADIVNEDFVVKGYVAAGRSVEFYVSTPTISGIGQARARIGLRTEGVLSGQDYDSLSGDYGPFMRGAYVGEDNAERFEFRFPLGSLPPELRYGSLVTAVTLGSTSEFGNAIPIGDMISRLAPVVNLPPGINLAQGDSLRVEGSFRDDDSTDWTLTVDYGDGTGVQPLSFAGDHTFLLEHDYTTVSTSPFQVIVTAIDNNQAVGTAVMGVIVSNEPPDVTFNQFEVTSQVLEGQVATLSGLFTDSGTSDSHAVTIDWGDGTIPMTTSLPLGARNFTATHVYPDDDIPDTSRDLYRVIVTVEDNHSGFSTTPDGLFVVEVINSPPTAPLLNAPASVLENQLFALEGTFSDIGLLDTHRVTIDWGDGSAKETATVAQLISNPTTRAFTVLHRYLDNPDAPSNSFTIKVEVADDDGPLSPTITSHSIVVTNETPLVTIASIIPSSSVINEGDLVTLDIGIDDSGSRDSHQVIIDWGDGSELTVYDLEPSVFTIAGVSHRYLNDPLSGSLYSLAIQARDKDMASDTFVSSVRSVSVNNVAPIVEPLQLFTRDSVGNWIERASGYSIDEGTEVRVTGRYSDPGTQDFHSVQFQWGIGHTTIGSVNNFANTFEAEFLYTDDFVLGTSMDDETILATVTDNDGLVGMGSTSVRVENVAPLANFVSDVVTDPAYNLIPLRAWATDRGDDPLVYNWTATVGSATIQSGTGPNFVLDRAGNPNATIVVTLEVTDGDLGLCNYTSAIKFGTSASEVLTVNASDFPFGVSTLMVLGLDGDDIIDGTSIAAPNRLLLDGGNGQDYLYGGNGDDTYILRAGNDSANVDSVLYPPQASGPPIPPISPNYFGNDRYLLKPNSTLTVVDLEGANSLDFTLASFGISFNLDTTRSATLVSQEVAIGGHYVAAVGDFNELIGSDFADQLTGASNATVSGGVGSDKLFAVANTTNARFVGDAGADEFSATGFGLSEISFEGDDGADIFTNFGELTEVVFTGGADADLFTNLGLSITDISFEGDDGADLFINEIGGSVIDISFEGDSGADRFINRGTIANSNPELRIHGDDGADVFENYGSLSDLIFIGGADAELFTNFSGSLTEISFEGDDGADIFTNMPNALITDISFEGDAGADRLINRGTIVNHSLLFRIEGDDGADVFENYGSLSDLIFIGGADADLFTNFDGVLSEISFEGDDGADVFTNEFGADVFEIHFEGDSGNDRFVNRGTIANLATSSRRVQGDDGADLFENFGTLTDLIFTGGADADLFHNFDATLFEVSFEGDGGADLFINELGGDIIDISFEGDDGADHFINRGTIQNTASPMLRIRGDDGADLFENFGSLTDLIFEGGADADEFANRPFGFLDQISFEGDDGVDAFVNAGNVIGLSGITFSGGADSDLFYNMGQIATWATFLGGLDADQFINGQQGVVKAISFEGDDGADLFENHGSVLTEIIFAGGADSDLLHNTSSGSIGTIHFHGDDGADSLITWGELSMVNFTGGADKDLFYNAVDDIVSIVFLGGADADVFHNFGDEISSISFEGDDGADVFICFGDELSTINFEGDDGADVLAVFGSDIGSISFEGDSSDTGNDTFVNRATSAGPNSTLTFFGFGGNDSLRNDGDGWDISCIGGGEDDVLQNNASRLTDIRFQGDDGADVFENNGDFVSGIIFEGDDGADVFANDGYGVVSISFEGDDGADLFINTGDYLSGIVFEGDNGADTFSNLGESVSNVTFNGGLDSGADRLLNMGARSNQIAFNGGSGGDLFLNRATAIQASELSFHGDDGADRFVNFGSELTDLVITGGNDADLFQNFGIDVSEVSFEGDEGDDQVDNIGSGLVGFLFEGGAGDDDFNNSGSGFDGILFKGGEGTNSLLQRGNLGGSMEFQGGTGTDIFVNYGADIVELEFNGDAGEDRLQNNGNKIETILFNSGPGAGALQNNGNLVGTLSYIGGDEPDTLLNNGSSITFLNFDGKAGADSLINTGDEISATLFDGGSDADLFRSQGTGIGNVAFIGANGDDAMLFNATSSPSTETRFDGGLGNDVLVFRGQTSSLIFEGGNGDDNVIVSGIALSGLLDLPTVSNPQADIGNDRYEFTGSPAGAFTIGETYSGVTDTSQDSIDFSAFYSGDIQIDIANTAVQPQPGGMTLELTSAMSIENVIGSVGGDVIRGNDRDNYIGGAQFYDGGDGSNPIIAKDRPSQWVLLDFDSATDQLSGEHYYDLLERSEVLQRISGTYHTASNWFNLRFTLDQSEIPVGIEFVTIRFNETPSYGRPGGESSEIDLGNINYGGEARVQVNGLLGGIELPASPTADFMEALPEDSESNVGRDMPIGTKENLIALSAKIAAHELGHLLGLRHYDAFGPVGFGIHSPPGASQFKPEYQGTSAAFETFDHIIGSPASVGTTRQNDVGELFFGEREAVKIAFAASGPADGRLDVGPLATWTNELPNSNTTADSAQAIEWKTISVPNTLAKGMNSSKTFFVDTLAVSGAIQLSGLVSENDYYSFAGNAGDVISIEIMSKALRRHSNNGVDGYIDSVVRLYRRVDATTVVPVSYYNSTAENDDEFESSDSVLFDVTLPVDAEYVIEVDTFTRSPRPGDPTPEELLEFPEDIRALLEDSLQDTDVGNYELFAYRFAQGSSVDGLDVLEGRGGTDQIDGGPGDRGTIELGPYPGSLTVVEGNVLVASIDMEDLRGESWTVEIDYGDGSTSVSSSSYNPSTGIPLSHRYMNDGTFHIAINVLNNYGVNALGQMTVDVVNVAPVVTAVSLSSPSLIEGQTTFLSGSFTDPSSLDEHRITIAWGDNSSDTVLTMGAGIFSFASVPHVYSDDNALDTYAVTVTVTDDDDASAPVTANVEVINANPSATLAIPSLINEGSSATFELASPFDPSVADLQSLRYSIALSPAGLATDYASASPIATRSLFFNDSGPSTIFAKIFDKDGGITEYSQGVNIINVAPTASLIGPASVNVGSSAVFSLTVADDVSSVDLQSLRYSFALASSGLAQDYSSASTSATAAFTFNLSGSISVFARVMDKDGGLHDYESTVVVDGDPPTDGVRVLEFVDRGHLVQGGAGVTDRVQIVVSLAEATNATIELELDGYQSHLDAGRANIPFSLPVLGISVVGFESFDKLLGLGDFRTTYVNPLVGSNYSETITGTSFSDLIVGNGGNDTLVGLGGNDIIIGSSGDDSISGGDGDDQYLYIGTSNGFDTLVGGSGLDQAIAPVPGAVIGINGYNNGVEEFLGTGDTIIRDTNYSAVLNFGMTLLTGILEIDAASGNDTITASNLSDGVYRGGSGDDVLAASSKSVTWLYAGTSNGYDTFTNGSGVTQAFAQSLGTVIGLNGYANGVETFLGQGDTLLTDTNYSSVLNFGSTLLTGILEVNAAGGNDTVIASNLSDGVYRGGSGDDALTASSKSVTWLYAGNSNGYDTFNNGSGVTQAIAQSLGTVIGLNGYANGVEVFLGQGDTLLTDTNYSSVLNFGSTLLTGIQEVNAAGGNDTVTASNLSDGVYRGGSGDDALTASSKSVTWLYAGNSNGYDTFSNGSGVTQAIAQSLGTVIGLNGYANGVETILGQGDTLLTDTNYSSVLNFGSTLLTGIQEVNAAGGNDTVTASNLSDGVYRGGSGDDVLTASSKSVTWLYAGNSNGYDTFSNGSGVTQAIAQSLGTVIGLNGYANGVETFLGQGDTLLTDTNYSSVLNFATTMLTGVAEINAAGGNDTVTASNLSDGVYRGGSGDDALTASSKSVTWLYAGNSNGYDTFSNGSGVTQAIAQSLGTVIGLNGYANGVETFLGQGDTLLTDTNYSSVLNFATTMLAGVAEINAAGGNDTVTASNLSDGVYRGGSGDDALTASSKSVTWLYAGNSNGYDTFTNGSGVTHAIAQSLGTVIGLNGYANGVETFLGQGDTLLTDTNYSSVLNFGTTLLVGIGEIDAAGGNDTIVVSPFGAANYRLGSGNDTLVLSVFTSNVQVSIIDFCLNGIDRIDLRPLAIAGGISSLTTTQEGPSVRIHSTGLDLKLLDFLYSQLDIDDFLF